MLAVKEFTLYGSRFQHGSPIPDTLWGRCDKRLRQVLERNRYVTHTPVAQADMPPRRATTPTKSDGPTRRGRPRKAV